MPNQNASLGCGSGFDPASLGGLFLWLKADAIRGLVDADPVSTWPDMSMNARSVTGTLTARPLYKTNIQNGRPVVRWDGSNDYMASASWGTLSQPCTFVAVEKHTTTSANMYIFDGIDTTNRQAMFTSGSPIGLNFFAGSTQARAIGPGAVRVHVATFDTTDMLHINDCLVGSGDAGAAASAGVTLGSRWNQFAGSFLAMDLSDLLIYSRALTAAERRALAKYFLIGKYALVFEPNRAAGQNAAAFLTTPTYDDASGQAIHPDIYYNAAGWGTGSKKYWMSMTPYTGNNSAVENPSILCSDDGTTWTVPAGVTNPLVAYPGGNAFNSDPCLIHAASDNKLYLYYRTSDGVANTDIISVISSADGVTWSAPAAMVSGLFRRVVAPSVVYNGSQFVMFYMDTGVSPYQLLKRTCATPNGTWSASSRSYLDPPTGQDLWHLSMQWDAATNQYHAFVATVPSGSTGGTPGYLYFATSQDGETWLLADGPILSPPGGATWDGYEIYRAGSVRTAAGYDIWYSARAVQPSPVVWHMGRTAVAL